MNVLHIRKTQSISTQVLLPIERVTSRAIIVRREDGAILSTQHREGKRYALPGGGIEDGESPEEAIIRELSEEKITLLGEDQEWQNRIAVDYYQNYKELAFWFIFVVDNATIGHTSEVSHTRWVGQDQDIWHPLMREMIILQLRKFVPDLVQ